MANMYAAKSLYDSGRAWTTSNWMFNPYMGMYTFVPRRGFYNSPFGFSFFSPRDVLYAYSPRPVNGGFGGGMNGIGNGGFGSMGYPTAGSRGSASAGSVAAAPAPAPTATADGAGSTRSSEGGAARGGGGRGGR